MDKNLPYQKIRGNQQSLGRPWLEIDIKLIRLMAGHARPQLIAKLFDRTYESLRQMCKREGISLRVASKKPSDPQRQNIIEVCRQNWRSYSIHKIFGSSRPRN